jgi:hypothetical protein
MTTCAEWQQMLADAQAAYHQYQLTGQPQSIRSGEKVVTYQPSSINGLLRYIGVLQARVNACTGRTGQRIIRVMPVDD